MNLGFEQPVLPGGYAWWYVDALSDDGRNGITVIAFIGSVFSPYYAWARRNTAGAPNPLHYCALNVALYGAGGKRWALTERGRHSVHCSASSLKIGPSALTWDGSTLTISIDEVTAPLPSFIRGRVRLHPAASTDRCFALDVERRHRWRPLAPCARVEVELQRPQLCWSGAGYLDSNAGDVALEHSFCGWDWSRATLRDGSTAVLYDVVPRAGKRRALALRFDPSGDVLDFLPPPPVPLPRTRIWRVPRDTRGDAGDAASVKRTFEDTPFYARSLLSAHLLGEPVLAVHESLSLERFAKPWVQALLPFRMPRAWR